MTQPPVAIGLLLCETVIVDERTKFVTPVNCFSRRSFRTFPSEPFSFTVVVLLTDGLGPGTLDLRLVNSEADEDALFHAAQPCRFVGGLDELRCTVRVAGVVFPEPGVYAVDLLADGEPVARRRLRVTLQEETP